MKKFKISLGKRSQLKIAGLGILWLALIIAGLSYVSNYENTAGAAAVSAPRQFPAESSLERAPDRPTLVMLVHPHCPCTRASLGELELLMAQTNNRARAYVLFLKPADFADDWVQTDTWQTASAIPGVTVVQDTDGREAQLFGGATSGQVYLYDSGGKMLFQGGITSARGHAGDNEGRAALTALLNGEPPAQIETAVYGCPLFNKNACPMPQ